MYGLTFEEKCLSSELGYCVETGVATINEITWVKIEINRVMLKVIVNLQEVCVSIYTHRPLSL